MLKHHVEPFRTGYTNQNKLSMVDVEKRNKEYRRLKMAKAIENYYEENRDSTIAAMEKAEFRHRQDLVPIVTRDLVNEAYKIFPEIILREYFTNLVLGAVGPETEISESAGIFDTQEELDRVSNGIRYMSHAYIKSLGGMQYLKETAERTGSEYLMQVYDTCMEAGKKIAAKKKVKLEKEINPENVDEVKLDLSVDVEDEEMIQKNMTDLNIDEISDLVKDKVLQVVKDEETAQEKDDQFISGIKEEIQQAKAKEEIPNNQAQLMTVNNGDGPSSSNGTDSGGTATTDSADGGDATGEVSKETEKEENDKNADTETKNEIKDAKTDSGKADKTKLAENARFFGIETRALNNRIDVRGSVLRSLTMRCYAQAVQENAAVKALAAKNARKNSIPPAELNIYDTFMHGENADLEYIDFARNSQNAAIASTSSTKIDPDEVLAEALVFFTALECAYEIKLINPTENELKNFIAYNTNYSN